jgi:hypothetical protein
VRIDNRKGKEMKPETIIIDDVKYVKADCINKPAEQFNGMKYVIVRTYSAGVFAGYLESRNGQEVVMRNARRIWYWEGAASLSQLSVDGTSCPDKCKFPCEVDRVELLQAIEILDCTEKAKKSIQGVKIWKM